MQELPASFLDNMKGLLSDEYEAYLKSFEEKRVYGLRVNTSKISVEDFLKISPFDLKPIPWTSNGFYYDGSEKPAKHPYYFAGLYYLQEPSAMLPAELLPIEEGDRVLDTCAAPGGKSTALSVKLHGTGTLFSNDISNSRAQALLKNLELFGVKNSVILSEDPLKMESHFHEYFDKILIDAPCSGEGMFRKEPAVIKSWVEHGNQFYVNIQKGIVKAALQMLRPGGMLLYSTCTFSPLEDEDMILYMKELCPELHVVKPPVWYEGFKTGFPDKAVKYDPELLNCIRIFPHKCQGEGHFVTLLQKGEREEKNTVSILDDSYKKGLIRLPKEVQEFFSSVEMKLPKGAFEVRQEKLLFTPDVTSNLKGLRVMRSGLLIGELKKNRFEPSQAFAMTLKKGEFKNELNLKSDDVRVIKYLKGETISLEDGENLKDGLVLILVDGFSLGFAKNSKGTLKNKYLAGWRWQ